MLVFVKFNFELCCITFFYKETDIFFFTRQKPVLALGNWFQASAVTYLLCSLWQGIFAYFLSPLALLPFQLKGVQARTVGEHSQGPELFSVIINAR